MTDPKIQNIFDFFKLKSEYNSSDVKSLFLLLHHNLTFKSIVVKNFYEVNKIMRIHNNPISDEIMWESSDSGLRLKMQQKINRHIFNYLSALFAYIDFFRAHSVPFLKKNANVFLLCQSLNSFKGDSMHKFIQDIRNFVIHKKPLPIVSELTMQIEWDAPRRNIYINKDDLLSGFTWTAVGRNFIEEQGEKIYVFEILKNHFDRFIKIQAELFLQLLKVSPELTNRFCESLKKIYDHAFLIGHTGSTPFNLVFLRYINSQIKRSKINDLKS